MKKALKILGGIVGFIILLVIIASVAVIMIVDKQLVETQMRNALHRHVVIGDISVSIFSVISGIEVKNVSISNYKTESQLKALEGKAVPGGDLFASLESFRFKVQFLPLLKRKFVLKELTLNGPVVHIVKSAGGQFNFSDLTSPKELTPEERSEQEKEKKEEASEEKKEFTAADLPVEITVGKVGIERGLVNYHDQKLGQSFQVYGLRALVYDIRINPKSLKDGNSLGVTVNTGLKSVGETKSGSIKSFDITFDVNGTVKPFNTANGKVDPEVSLKMGSPNGYFTGLQIFDRITENDQLNKYMGKHLDFLKGKTEWKGSKAAYVSAYYKGGTARLSDGRINAREVVILFEGSTNINTKAIGLKIDLELSDSRKGAVQTGIRKNVESGLKKLGVDKYVKAENITNSAMRPLLNDRGEIYLRFAASGTTAEPKVTLVHPSIGSIEDVIKGAGGEVTKALQQEAENRAKSAVNKASKEAENRAKRGAQKLLRKLF
jgi:hypothetical protein